MLSSGHTTLTDAACVALGKQARLCLPMRKACRRLFCEPPGSIGIRYGVYPCVPPIACCWILIARPSPMPRRRASRALSRQNSFPRNSLPSGSHGHILTCWPGISVPNLAGREARAKGRRSLASRIGYGVTAGRRRLISVAVIDPQPGAGSQLRRSAGRFRIVASRANFFCSQSSFLVVPGSVRGAIIA